VRGGKADHKEAETNVKKNDEMQEREGE